jgi:hypothetical protein
MRTIHLDGLEWRYRIFSGVVVIYSPAHKKTVVSFSELTGLDCASVEKGMRKRWLHITPSMVKDYITQLTVSSHEQICGYTYLRKAHD